MEEWQERERERESRVGNTYGVWCGCGKGKNSEREEPRQGDSEGSPSYLYRIEVVWKIPSPAWPKTPGPSLPSLCKVKGSES